jgi:hypothetical protein
LDDDQLMTKEAAVSAASFYRGRRTMAAAEILRLEDLAQNDFTLRIAGNHFKPPPLRVILSEANGLRRVREPHNENVA